ncbi:hypothetical protein EDD86DRAFT_208292 [Gorgonomyces haynaldii]|nr:hypothetical protein EDD86DRAFT_208292 [Gorgonomyces haynaldii]
MIMRHSDGVTLCKLEQCCHALNGLSQQYGHLWESLTRRLVKRTNDPFSVPSAAKDLFVRLYLFHFEPEKCALCFQRLCQDRVMIVSWRMHCCQCLFKHIVTSSQAKKLYGMSSYLLSQAPIWTGVYKPPNAQHYVPFIVYLKQDLMYLSPKLAKIDSLSLSIQGQLAVQESRQSRAILLQEMLAEYQLEIHDIQDHTIYLTEIQVFLSQIGHVSHEEQYRLRSLVSNMAHDHIVKQRHDSLLLHLEQLLSVYPQVRHLVFSTPLYLEWQHCHTSDAKNAAVQIVNQSLLSIYLQPLFRKLREHYPLLNNKDLDDIFVNMLQEHVQNPETLQQSTLQQTVADRLSFESSVKAMKMNELEQKKTELRSRIMKELEIQCPACYLQIQDPSYDSGEMDQFFHRLLDQVNPYNALVEHYLTHLVSEIASEHRRIQNKHKIDHWIRQYLPTFTGIECLMTEGAKQRYDASSKMGMWLHLELNAMRIYREEVLGHALSKRGLHLSVGKLCRKALDCYQNYVLSSAESVPDLEQTVETIAECEIRRASRLKKLSSLLQINQLDISYLDRMTLKQTQMALSPNDDTNQKLLFQVSQLTRVCQVCLRDCR